MIVHINHISQSKKPKGNQRSPQSELASLVTGSLMSLVEEGVLDARLAPSLRIHLDWIQYKTNFRDPVIVRRTTNLQGQILPLAEIAIDLRQADASRLPDELAQAVKNIGAGPQSNNYNHLYLDDFKPYRDCLIWAFNRLFWRHLGDWEAMSGKGFEAALPGGTSDANHPQAVHDAVADFWTLLRDLENRNQLPQEIVGLEIGVGSGARAAAWLDRFKSLDALNPEKSLTKYRFKLMYVHLTNVYDNLPFDDLVRRDGKLYLVEVRAYLNGPAVDRLTADFGLTREELPGIVKKLLDEGPFAVFPGEKGVDFWRRLWDTFKLEERLRVLDDREEDHVPPGLNRTHLEDLLAEAPDDVRFHISRGAGESFANTLPLLHPRGYLQVQDIFVSDMDDYRKGFRGPGKLDGSLVTWVNGALLRAVGPHAGYDVHFAPFPYRPGTKTSILYTTQRD